MNTVFFTFLKICFFIYLILLKSRLLRVEVLMNQDYVSRSFVFGLFSNRHKKSDLKTANQTVLDDFFNLIDSLSAQSNPSRKIFAIEQYWNNELSYRPLNDEVKILINKTKLFIDSSKLNHKDVTEYLYEKRIELSGVSFETLEELENHIDKTNFKRELMTLRINNIDDRAIVYTKSFVRAVSILVYINNLNQDSMRRLYFMPRSLLVKYGLKYPNQKNAFKYPGAFRELIESLIIYYSKNIKEGTKLKNFYSKDEQKAFDKKIAQYNDLAKRIFNDPFIIYNLEEDGDSGFRLVNLVKARL